MSDDAMPTDNSLKLIGSSTINYAVIVTLGGCLLSSVWYIARKDAALETLTAAVAAQNTTLNQRIEALNTATNQRITDGDAATNLRVSRITDDVLARLKVLEARNEALGASLVDQGNRLTRIESKIDFLTQTVAPRK